MIRLCTLAVLVSVLTLGCEEGPPRCTPGASVACACPQGTEGAQLCRGDGTFAPCACTIAIPSGAVPEPVPPAPTEPASRPEARCVDPAQDAARRAGEELGSPPLDPLEATVEQVDSDADGVPELVVSFFDFCGNAPTCQHWVYAPAAEGECRLFVRTWDRRM